MNENKLKMLQNLMTNVDKIVVSGQNDECDFEAELDEESVQFISERINSDLKAKYQKAVEDAEKYKSERDFIKEYLNPADLSFRYMIDAFKVLPVEKQGKLIALAKSLSELGEKG